MMYDLCNVPQSIQNLLLAVENGDTHKVQSILDQDISVETTDADGNSLLQIAAANGHENIVRLLLIRGAALDRKNLYGWTPLMQAARYGHESVVLHLLNSKTDINTTTMMGISALTLAVKGGHNKVVEILLENHFTVDCVENTLHFATPLMVATLGGRDDLLRTLLRWGVPADQRHIATGWTALMVTAMTGQLPMARLLVDKGCDPNRKNRHEKTALAIATECELREIRGYLDRKTTDKPEKVDDQGIKIIAAVKKGDYEKVKEILINHKDECNATTTDGATPLMYAAITGQTEMIKLLVENGADVNAKDYENGWTALMQATYYSKVEAAKCLIGLNADVGCRAKNNITAFDMALLINAPTSLFRLLAEHAMQTSNSSAANGKTIVEGDVVPSKLTNTTMAWANTVPCEIQATDDRQKEAPGQGTQKKSMWSKLGKPFKNIKLTRTFRSTFKNPNKVDNFESTLIASGDDACDQKDGSHGNSVTIADPYSMTNHSAPKSRLPEEKLALIQPPFQSTAGVDRHNTNSQKKTLGSRTSMSASLNSSGESSVSRSVVKPVKFLQSPGNSGCSNTGSSPHSSGGASDVTHSFSLPKHGNNPHKQSGDRYSDTVLSKMAQMKQRKDTSSNASGGRIRGSISAEQLSVQPHQKTHGHRRMGSRVSIVSSQSTSSTLTPPRSPEPQTHSDKMRSRYTGSGSRGMSSPDSTHSHKKKRRARPVSRPTSFNEDDELSVILQKLSLENYHPIFEKEEIDMDTFLTMTNGDLRSLGITQEFPRQQLLKAINHLSEGKENYKKPGGIPTYSYSITSDSERNSSKKSSSSTQFEPPSWSYYSNVKPRSGS
ncbi:ankyrin repeat and SAM domain-containing protein 6-like [Styela clava]